ncbi:hypothetical protein NXX23_17530 [Bacteroides ovatus]|nr:hypothetical protein [Bacteroides ovatus]
MKPKDNGLVNLHDRKREERGFCCMQLIIFLTDNGVKSWDEWHRAHTDASGANADTASGARFMDVANI